MKKNRTWKMAKRFALFLCALCAIGILEVLGYLWCRSLDLVRGAQSCWLTSQHKKEGGNG